MPESGSRATESSHAEPRGAVRRIAAVVSGSSRVNPSEIIASLTGNGDVDLELHIHVAKTSSEATRAAKQAARSANVVIAVGGDGTVSDVATGIFNSDAALGIVPAGSTNIAARSLGIPADPTAALALLRGSHRLRAIDLGRSEDRSFVHVAGAGLDAEIFSGASPVWKRRLGWLAYLPAAMAALRLPPSDVRITTDGAVLEVRSSLVLIANGGSAIAPQFQIYPGITVDDGWLDALIFTASTPVEIAKALGLAGMQQLHRSSQVIHRRTKSIGIEAEPPLPVELDGDPRGTTPRQFRIVPLGLRVVAPLLQPVGTSR
jgi:YegS/Rv2252/BmrU family lipid kinase